VNLLVACGLQGPAGVQLGQDLPARFLMSLKPSTQAFARAAHEAAWSSEQ
jgi:hypothetical protein